MKRRLTFHGHLVRKGGITLDLMIGRLLGTRPRGRPRTTWLKDLAAQVNISYKEAMTIPRDRKKWMGIGKPRRTPASQRVSEAYGASTLMWWFYIPRSGISILLLVPR